MSSPKHPLTPPNDAFIELDALILKINFSAPDAMFRFGELRQLIDEYFDQGKITVSEWRRLIERAADLRSKWSR
jgi:hypothetical protein